MGKAVWAAIVVLASSAGSAADLVVHGVSGYTCTAGGVLAFDALRVDAQGRVVATAIGDPWRHEPGLRRHDGAGATLLPGLIDAHGHVLALGRLRDEIDLSGAKSLRQALVRVRAFAEAYPNREWILGRGWNQELWPRREFPTAQALDDAVPGRAVWLRRVDGHAGWASSEAMQRAGVGRETRSPAGGSIIRGESGNPSGIFVDQAMALIATRIPEPDAAADREALKRAFTELLGLGLTSVHDAGVDARTLALYRELAAAKALPLRIYALLSGDELALEVGAPRRDPDARLDVAAVKLYADGALGSRGAALLAPYADAPGGSGLMFHSKAELKRQVAPLLEHGFQVAIHAIGDAANRQALDVYSELGIDPAHRHRIEHAQIVTLADIPRFAELGIVASMQPTHATSDRRMAIARLGPDRLDGAYAWQRFLGAGVTIAAGSDFPVEAPNPFHGLHAAVTRRDADGEPPGGWTSRQRLSRAEALCAFTRDAAYAAHQEEDLGTLEPGKWADFVLIDRDYFRVPADAIRSLRVMQTWSAGKPVHRASGPPR